MTEQPNDWFAIKFKRRTQKHPGHRTGRDKVWTAPSGVMRVLQQGVIKRELKDPLIGTWQRRPTHLLENPRHSKCSLWAGSDVGWGGVWFSLQTHVISSKAHKKYICCYCSYRLRCLCNTGPTLMIANDGSINELTNSQLQGWILITVSVTYMFLVSCIGYI